MITYLSNEDEENQDQPNPRSPDAQGSLEWNLIEGTAVIGPGSTEPNVCEADLRVNF